MKNKVALLGLYPEEIADALEIKEMFRATQIFKWAAKGASSFDEMSDLSKDLRRRAAQIFSLRTMKETMSLKGDDGTVKMQLSLEDGKAVESVLLFDSEGRKTACLSSQVGCAMKCAFCKTGTLGFAGNLSAAEIVEQFLRLEEKCGEIKNIVFMGMGEPLLNLSSLLRAVKILTHPKGRSLSERRITVSTSGIVNAIYKLADSSHSLRLALSLTSADPFLRSSLMPINLTNPLGKLKEAIKYYATKSGRRVTLEAVMLKGKNMDMENARNLAAFTRGLNVNVNLIPWNPVPNMPFERPTEKEIAEFVRLLRRLKVPVVVRKSRGSSVAGACGQLGKAKSNEKDDKGTEDAVDKSFPI